MLADGPEVRYAQRRTDGDKPRERLLREGPDTLTTAELIAVLLRTGVPGRPALRVAEELLERFGSLDRLAQAGLRELSAASGMGPAKVAVLRASLELGARWVRTPLLPGEPLGSPEQVARHFGPRMRGYRQEVFVVVLLDARQRVLGEVEVSRGSVNQSLVHPREVFAAAVREAATFVLLVHNHPSGDSAPSPEDREVTRRLARAGELLGIPVLDHLVIAGHGHHSFARSGELPAPANSGWSSVLV